MPGNIKGKSRRKRSFTIFSILRSVVPQRAAMLIFLGALALQGGISRLDVVAQAWPRLAAMAAIVIVFVFVTPSNYSRVRWPMIFVGLAAALVMIQLLPLPPSLWQNFPGRQIYVPAAAELGIQQPWRPWSLTPDRSWNALAALIIPAAALYVLARCDLADRGRVLGMLFSLVAFSAILGVLQLSSGDLTGFQIYSEVTSFSAGGIFANRNHQALFLATGLPMLPVLAFDYRPVWARNASWLWICGILTVFVLLAIPTTGSRAGLLAGGIGLTAAIAIAWPFMADRMAHLRPKQRSLAIALILLLLATVLMTALFGAQSGSLNRLFAQDASADRRFAAIEPIMRMIQTFLPVGSGFGSFDPVYRHFEPTSGLSTSYLNEAHNEYLQVAAEGGVLGIALLLAALLWLAWRAYQVVVADPSPAIRLARLGAVMLAMIAVASLVDYPARTPLFMMVAAVAAGWLEAGAVGASRASGRRDGALYRIR